MLFDRQSSVRGLVAAALVTVAMTSPGARAVPSTPIEGISYFVAPGGVGVSTDRARPGNVNDTVRKICDGTAAQIAGGDAIIFLNGFYLTSSLNLPLPADERQPGRHGNAIAMLDKNCGGPLYVKLLADNDGRAIVINDVRSNDTSGGFDIRRSSFIWIEGFRIVGINDPAVIWERGIDFSAGSHHVVARNNRIDRVGGVGIGAGGASHVRFEGNQISGAANQHPFCSSAISLYRMENAGGFADDADGYANYVVGNKVFGTRSRAGCDADAFADNGVRSSDGNCIILDLNNQTGYSNRTLIANNLCVDNGGGGAHIFNSAHVDVINNTFYGNGAVHRLGDLSVTCSGSGTLEDVRFINNLVWATSTAPAVASNFNGACQLSGIVHARNVFVGNGPMVNDFLGTPYLLTTTDPAQFRGSDAANLVGVTPTESGIARADADPVIADFSIASPGSQLVDGGVSLDCPPPSATPCNRAILPPFVAEDVAGRPRVAGTIDIGAHEYQAQPPAQGPSMVTMTLRARATLAAGVGPLVAIHGDGKLLGTVMVDSVDYADYAIEYPAQGFATVDVVFTNDAVVGGEDRNLFVESLRVGDRVLRPTDAGTSFDIGSAEGAFDGSDVIAGQPNLWWGGALRFQLPAQ